MTEYAYDPASPYVVAGRESGILFSRFRYEDDAQAWADYSGLLMIDTTPKPKIPVDAQFIAYRSPIGGDAVLYARRYGHSGNKVWQTSNPISCIDEQELVRLIGDAEVTVLVPKENG